MLANFFNSSELKKVYGVSFSFRHSELYATGLVNRLQSNLQLYPVFFPDLSYVSPLSKHFPLFARRTCLGIARVVLFWPLFLYEISVLFSLFKRLSPDILHINNGGYPAALSARAAAIAGYFAGVPVVMMVVNNMAADYRHYSRWMDYPVDRLVVHAISLFVTGSAAASIRLQQVLKLPSSKLLNIHNGIALRKATASVAVTRERLGLSGFDGVVFSVVALLIPRKGHRVLLEAVLKLASEKMAFLGANFVIMIEGDGPLRQELVAFVEKHDLSKWVKFVGEEENIVDFMIAVDVLILPSIEDEDFPNVTLEAMALGKPVIASRLAGTPEQVNHGVTGLLVEPRNVDQLASAIFDLLTDAEVRTKMGMAARDRFNNNFTTGKAIANYMNVYNKLTGSIR